MTVRQTSVHADDLYRSSYFINNAAIESVDQVCDIGVFFNNKLRFNPHYSLIVVKAQARLFLLRKCFVTTSPDLLVKAYYVLVRPIIEYCSQMWLVSLPHQRY